MGHLSSPNKYKERRLSSNLLRRQMSRSLPMTCLRSCKEREGKLKRRKGNSSNNNKRKRQSKRNDKQKKPKDCKFSRSRRENVRRTYRRSGMRRPKESGRKRKRESVSWNKIASKGRRL
jgi:hypothetical protein